MFSSFFPSSLPKLSFSRGWSAGAVNIPAVEIHDVEVLSDKRGRRLKHLLRLNHATFSILYNHLRFHNHTPHVSHQSLSPIPQGLPDSHFGRPDS